MAGSLNKVMVIGSVGRSPEMRYMPSGQPVASFSVGATRSWNDAQGKEHEETEWFNVVAWGDLAERCKKTLRENHQVYVEGRLQTRSWQTENEQRRFRAELVANDVILLNASSENDHVPEQVSDQVSD